MKRSYRVLTLLLAASVLQGCDVTATSNGPEKDYVFKQFGERCAANVECESTYCLSDDQGDFCTRQCGEGCPEGWTCENVPSPHNDGSILALCTKPNQVLCTACTSNETCGSNGANLCLTYDDGRFCALDCTYQSCPDGYTCKAVDGPDGNSARQCVPKSNSCVCSAETEGQIRGCTIKNEHGSCSGNETCGSGQWQTCDAKTPEPESCNGIDDNCDGFIDEATDGTTRSRMRLERVREKRSVRV